VLFVDVGQTIESQNSGVDSGFSSSSPADRQSPSPKIRFTLDENITQSESAPADDAIRVRNITEAEAEHLKSITSTHQDLSQLDKSAISGNSVSSNVTVKQEMVDNAYSQRSDLSIPSQNSTTQYSATTSTHAYNPQPLNVMGASENQKDLQDHKNVKNVLDALAQQAMTKTETAVETNGDEAPPNADAAFLLKHNKIAVPPSCNCNARPCEYVYGMQCAVY